MELEELCIDCEHVTSSARLDRGLYYTEREWAIRIAKCKTLSLPGTTWENIMFNLSRTVLKSRYELFIFSLEDKFPLVYNLLTKMGLPKIHY